MAQFTSNDWYWTVADDATRFYSSKRNIYVMPSDPEYAEWAAFNLPKSIQSEAELWGVVGYLHPAWMAAPDGNGFIQDAEGVLTEDQLKRYSADARWRKEQGGITTTAGFPIKTDDRSQAKITGVYTASQENPAVITPWHAADGSIQQLDAAGMFGLHVDLLTHINNCFDISEDVIAGIEGGTITAMAQIDDAYAAPITSARKNWLKTSKG